MRATFLASSTYRLQIFCGRVNIVMSVFQKISTLTTIGGSGEPIRKPSFCVHTFFSIVNTADLRQNVRGSISSVGDAFDAQVLYRDPIAVGSSSGPAVFELQCSVARVIIFHRFGVSFKLIAECCRIMYVRVRFVVGTAPCHVSIPPNQNGTMAKGR